MRAAETSNQWRDRQAQGDRTGSWNAHRSAPHTVPSSGPSTGQFKGHPNALRGSKDTHAAPSGTAEQDDVAMLDAGDVDASAPVTAVPLEAFALAASATADSFEALGLDPRLVAKLMAAKDTAAAPPAAPVAPGQAAAAVISSASSGIARGVLRQGFGLQRPTRVQRLSVPHALARDGLHSCLVKSETGSGKTLAFLLPLVQDLLRLNDAAPVSRADGTLALVLAPTRELCQQIHTVAVRLTQPFHWLVPGIVAGGEKRKSEKARLRKGVTLLVATPGRLLDHLRTTEAFGTRKLRTLVFDEADRLLDMGFGTQVRGIVQLLRDRAAGKNTIALPGGSGKTGAPCAGKPWKQHLQREADSEGEGEGAGAGEEDGEEDAVALKLPPLQLGATLSGRNTWQMFLISATLSSKVKALARELVGPVDPRAASGATVPRGSGGVVLVNAALDLDASAAVRLLEGDEDWKQAGNTDEDGDGDAANAAAPASTAAVPSTSEAGPPEPADGENAKAAPMDTVEGEKEKRARARVEAIAAQALGTEGLSVPTQLQQFYSIVPIKWRLVTLLAAVFDAMRPRRKFGVGATGGFGTAGGKVILFLSTCDAVDFHFHLLHTMLPAMAEGYAQKEAKAARLEGETAATDLRKHVLPPFPIFRLHGNVPQATRTQTYRGFTTAASGILIATDVAARGLDLPAVDLILQADSPSDSMDYVHRIGRTARRGEAGRAILFLQPHEEPYADVLAAAGLKLSKWDATPILGGLSKAPTDGVAQIIAAHQPVVDEATQSDGKGNGKNRNSGRNDKQDDDDEDEEDPTMAVLRAHAHLLPESHRAQLDKSAGPGADGEKSDANAEGGQDSLLGKRKRTALDPSSPLPTRLQALLAAMQNVKGTNQESRRGPDLLCALWQCIAEELTRRLPVLRDEAAVAAAAAAVGGANKAWKVVDVFPSLLQQARAAFSSFVRGYATHEKATRHIFHPKALHLGHAAKACGLTEAPSLASNLAKVAAATAIQEKALKEQREVRDKKKAAREEEAAAAGKANHFNRTAHDGKPSGGSRGALGRDDRFKQKDRGSEGAWRETRDGSGGGAGRNERSNDRQGAYGRDRDRPLSGGPSSSFPKTFGHAKSSNDSKPRTDRSSPRPSFGVSAPSAGGSSFGGKKAKPVDLSVLRTKKKDVENAKAGNRLNWGSAEARERKKAVPKKKAVSEFDA
jgi:superfamily II DNA/RNA helicase